MLEKFSIFIPYHVEVKTLYFLEKQLQYYNNHHLIFKVVIALSGNKALRDKAKKIIEDINNKNFSYIESKEDEIRNFISYVSKIYSALQNIETDYVAINGVDDLIFPEVAYDAIKFMAKDNKIAGAKGHTLYYNNRNGRLFAGYDVDFMENTPIERETKAIKDLDSVWYVVRRTKDLQEDYKLLLNIVRSSSDVSRCLYKIELIKSILMMSRGKVFVMNKAWRIQTSHDWNHSSHTPALVVRLESGIIKKKYFSYLKSNTNIYVFRFLFFISNIRSADNITFKMIVYRFLKEGFDVVGFFRLLMYYTLNRVIYSPIIKILGIFKKKKQNFYEIDFSFKREPFKSLKDYYFTEEEVNKIQLNPRNQWIDNESFNGSWDAS